MNSSTQGIPRQAHHKQARKLRRTMPPKTRLNTFTLALDTCGCAF